MSLDRCFLHQIRLLVLRESAAMLACLAGQAVVSVEENHHPLPLLRLPGFDAGVVAGPLAAEVGEQPQQVREVVALDLATP